MTTQAVSVTGVAASAALCPDTNNAAASIGIYVKVGAACTLTIQVTADDPAGASPNWFSTGVAALTAITADAVAALPYPARGVRINQTAGANTSSMQVINAGLL